MVIWATYGIEILIVWSLKPTVWSLKPTVCGLNLAVYNIKLTTK